MAAHPFPYRPHLLDGLVGPCAEPSVGALPPLMSIRSAIGGRNSERLPRTNRLAWATRVQELYPGARVYGCHGGGAVALVMSHPPVRVATYFGCSRHGHIHYPTNLCI
jgi:hypothetical protein